MRPKGEAVKKRASLDPLFFPESVAVGGLPGTRPDEPPRTP